MENNRIITLKEISQHNNSEDLWIIIHNKIYDLTKFQNEHPGGEDVLIDVAGKDGTKDFDDVGHSQEAQKMMEQYCIGELAECDRKRVKLDVRQKQMLIALGALSLGIVTIFILRNCLTNRN